MGGAYEKLLHENKKKKIVYYLDFDENYKICNLEKKKSNEIMVYEYCRLRVETV